MAGRKSNAGKQKRRARGTGTIFYSKAEGRWIGRKPVGRTPKGQTAYAEVRGKTQGEVVRRLALVGRAGPDTTVGEWADRWLGTLQNRPSTRARYEKAVRVWVKPHLGAVRLRDLVPSRVDGWVRTMAATLRPGSVRFNLAVAGAICRAAVRDGLIPTNPAAAARRPKVPKTKIDPFTPAELAGIIDAAAASPPLHPVALMAGVGCRIGEALGLDVGHYDPGAGRLTIATTFDREHGTGPPKTERGTRTIRVPLVVRPVLAAAIGRRTAGPLFLSGARNRRIAPLVRAAWGRLLARLGHAPRNPHQLRHSVATAMISAGVPIGDVAAYLGDAPATVVATYLHAAGTDPADALDRLLGGRKVGGKGATAAKCS